MDQFEAAVKKLELTKREWRSKFAIKEGELQAVQVRNNELHSQISSLKSDTISGSSSQLRSLTERAVAAEKRAQTASNQLASLEERLAEYQTRYSQAENKWEARVKEYENRLRIAGEKIKTEKQGGKERAVQLEAQVRCVPSIYLSSSTKLTGIVENWRSKCKKREKETREQRAWLQVRRICCLDTTNEGGGRHSDQPFFLQLRVLPHMGLVYIRIIYDAFPFLFLDLCTYGGRDGMGYNNGNEKVTSCEGDHNGSGMKSSSASTL